MYCRYSANSTLKPLKGLRCRPEMKPSTTVRALSSSVPSRATTAGSRNCRSRALAGHAYIPLFGGGTASSSRSTMASELIRSDSA